MRCAEKKSKHGIENKHLQKQVSPFVEPTLGVWQKIGYECERRNDEEQNDKGLARRHDDKGCENGYDAGEDDRNEQEDGTRSISDGGAANGEDGTASNCAGDLSKGVSFGCAARGSLDIGKYVSD